MRVGAAHDGADRRETGEQKAGRTVREELRRRSSKEESFAGLRKVDTGAMPPNQMRLRSAARRVRVGFPRAGSGTEPCSPSPASQFRDTQRHAHDPPTGFAFNFKSSWPPDFSIGSPGIHQSITLRRSTTAGRCFTACIPHSLHYEVMVWTPLTVRAAAGLKAKVHPRQIS